LAPGDDRQRLTLSLQRAASDVVPKTKGEPGMKSKNTLVSLSIMFLVFAVTTSVVMWPDVSSAAKIAFFAYGFGAGAATGAWMARRRQ
jgi:hypothetical protein